MLGYTFNLALMRPLRYFNSNPNYYLKADKTDRPSSPGSEGSQNGKVCAEVGDKRVEKSSKKGQPAGGGGRLTVLVAVN